MILTPRQQREKEIYDKFASSAEVPKLGDEFPLPNREHSDFFPYFLSQIGDVTHKSVLEIGSGSGYLSCWIAKLGAWVAGIDVSEKFVRLAQATASENDLNSRTMFQVAVAEKLPFDDGTFDIVVGNQILHHLEIPAATKEIYRVLKPGGKAVFCEPIGFSPIIEKVKDFAKKKLNHADHRHTPDERILNRIDLAILRTPFRSSAWRGFQLFTTKISRLIRLPDKVFYALLRIDSFISRFLPFSKKYARLAVIVLRK